MLIDLTNPELKEFSQSALDIISKRWPKVYDQLSQEEGDYPEIEVMEEAIHPTLRYNGIQLAGAYNPEEEAVLQAAKIPKEAKQAFVYGVGQGYLVQELLKRKQLKQLDVVLLNSNCFWHTLGLVDHCEWLSDSRVSLHIPDVNRFAVYPPFAVSTAMLSLVEEEDILLPIMMGIHWGGLLEVAPNFEPDLIEQLEENESLIAQDGNVEKLFDTFLGKEVIVCGAGPSIDASIEWIKEKQKEGVPVIVPITALMIIIPKGLKPDIVVNIDDHIIVASALEMDLTELEDVPLVYFPTVHNDVLTRWPGPRSTAYHGNSYYEDVHKEMAKRYPKGELFSYGSVIHAELDLAVRMGAATIYLTGVDFGFPGNRHHGEGFFADHKVREIPQATIVNGFGERIPSSYTMIIYRNELAKYIARVNHSLKQQKRRPISFILLNKMGAEIPGTTFYDQARIAS